MLRSQASGPQGPAATISEGLGEEPVGRLDVPGVDLIRVLGHGGFGSVFLGRRQGFDELVAVKVLYTLLADSISAFEREARMLGRLSGHPNVVDVYESGRTSDGRPYLVIEYVNGGSLKDAIERGSLDWETAVRIGIDVARGLDHAHTSQVLHRDVKPSNVLLTQSGSAKLTDFGIAKLQEAESTTSARLVTTVMYAPPEVVSGQAAEPASDVYSLGATIYASLTGHPPFTSQAESIIPVLRRIVAEDAPPIEPWHAPIAVRRQVMAALERDPADRPGSAGDFAAALEAALDQGRSETLPERPAAGDITPITVTVDGPTVVTPDIADPDPWSAFPPPSETPPPMPAPMPEPASPVGSGPPASASLPPPAPPRSPTPLGPPPTPLGPPPSRPASPGGEVGSPPSNGQSGDAWCRLRPDFRFVHGPLVATETGIPFVGSQDLVDQLASRLRYSRSGAILITGFRGAGKTTLARRAIEQLAEQSDEQLISVMVNVARPVGIQELLTMILRQLFERLSEEDLMARVDPQAARALVLAYLRTSVQLKQSQGMSGEVGSNLGFEKWGLKLGLSGKTVETLASEAQYVAYSEADLEYDLLRTASLLANPGVDRLPDERPGWRRFLLPRSAREPVRVRTIVVVDELDKLTSNADGMKALDKLLSSFKNVLASNGLTFVFVGGADLHDRYRADIHRGNSIYESIFSWNLYVPCQWDAPDRLLDELIESTSRIERETLRSFVRYECRGLHRRLLQNVNQLVVWRPDGPRLEMTEPEVERIKVLAEVDDLVCSDAEVRAAVERGSIEADRRLLSVYYAADWILRTAGSEFAVADLVRQPRGDGTGLAIDPLLRVDADEVNRLVERMEVGGIVRRSPNPLPDVPTSYSLCPDYADRVVVAGLSDPSFEGPFEDGTQSGTTLTNGPGAGTEDGADTSASHHPEPAAGPPPVDLETTLSFDGRLKRAIADVAVAMPALGPGSVLDNRYELIDVVDSLPLGTLYRANDRIGGGEVAIKLISSPTLLADEHARARLEREVAVAEHLDHPRIIRTIDVVDLGPSGPARVMEYVGGRSLADVIETGPCDPHEAVQIAYGLAHAVGYLSDRGVTRLGLVPSNILIDTDGQPKILDFGLARRTGLPIDEITAPGLVVGEVSYLAPEQRSGQSGDVRGDLYSVGVFLVEMLLGPERGPAGNPDWAADLSGRASIELQALLLPLLDEDPDGRPSRANKVIDLLNGTPEGQRLRDDGLALVDRGPTPEHRASSGAAPAATVAGILCSRGHFNNPASAYCQVCGISMLHLTHEIIEGIRPSLGFLVFDDGSVFELNRSYVIGREPGAAASSDIAPLAFIDNADTLSRSHAEVRLDEWVVQLVDLYSTNGTFVWDRSNERWNQLAPGEVVALQPGDTVALGRRTFVFESTGGNLIPASEQDPGSGA